MMMIRREIKLKFNTKVVLEEIYCIKYATTAQVGTFIGQASTTKTGLFS